MRNHKLLSLCLTVVVLIQLLLSTVLADITKYTGYIYDAFDTNITLIAYCSSEDEFNFYLEAANKEFLRLHRLFDIYNTYPDLNNAHTINANAGKEAVTVDPELIELIQLSKEMYSLTDGCVNIAMGSVLTLWHNCREYNSIPGVAPLLPNDERLHEASYHTNIDSIIINLEESTVFIDDIHSSIDLGAVAKGYAVESVTRMLADSGCHAFAINAGGNIRVYGQRPDGKNWNVGITDPSNTSKSIASVSVGDKAVVTSGVYQRFFTVDGVRYHHIIDGTSLRPENRYLSVTVISFNSSVADALSTAIFNMEISDGKLLAERLDDTEVMWILSDGSIEYTEGFSPSAIY